MRSTTPRQMMTTNDSKGSDVRVLDMIVMTATAAVMILLGSVLVVI